VFIKKSGNVTIYMILHADAHACVIILYKHSSMVECRHTTRDVTPVQMQLVPAPQPVLCRSSRLQS
jgi:hypothetical protein